MTVNNLITNFKHFRSEKGFNIWGKMPNTRVGVRTGKFFVQIECSRGDTERSVHWIIRGVANSEGKNVPFARSVQTM
jgi:hypothetical protein